MMKTCHSLVLTTIALSSVACGGATSGSDLGGASATNPGSQPAQPGTQPAQGTDTSTAGDVPPSASDPCSLLQPGSARALPEGIVVPSAPALKITFDLENQKIVMKSIREEGVVPPWTSKDTQIFSADTTSGFWVETRDAAGSLSFQRNLYDPLGRQIEATPNPNDPNQGWKNINQCTSTAEFDVEIPGDAAEVRVYGSEKINDNSVLIAWYRLR